MNSFKALHLEPGRAICYSGFREGQSPAGIFPSYDEVKEDLLLLQKTGNTCACMIVMLMRKPFLM